MVCSKFTYWKTKINYHHRFISNDQKYLIKKYIFPYKVIKQHENTIGELDGKVFQQQDVIKTFSNKLEVIFKQSLQNIEIEKTPEKELSNSLVFKNNRLVEGFYAGIANTYAGSGYIDFHSNNLIVLSSRGVLGYSDNLDQITLINKLNITLINL